MFVNYNGAILPASQPIFTADNRAFRYGDGLFESIRVFDGEMPCLERHWQRLSSGMVFLKMDIPDFFSPIFFQNEIKKLTQNQGNWRIRLTVWRSGAGLYTPEANQPAFLITANLLPSSIFELNENGLNVGIFHQVHLPLQPLQSFKTITALPFVLASIFKKENNLDDCLLLNAKDRLACGTSSNIFMVKNGELYTPLLNEGCVAGTMRATLLDLANQLGVNAHELPLNTDLMEEMDEIFLTNAIQGVRWVRQVEGFGKQFSNELAVVLVKALNQSLLPK